MLGFLKRGPAVPPGANVEFPVYGDDGGAFAALKHRRVLIYWPHGFGDFVHLSYVVPLLEPSNTYFITRYGDDFVHLYDEGEIVRPLLSGTRRIGDGSELGIPPHGGLDVERSPNRVERFVLPEALKRRVEAAGIDTVLASHYREMTGRTPYPWHTKARYLVHKLVAPERIAQFDLARPLRSSLALRAPAEVSARIEARLRAFVAPGERLYVVSSGGHTQLDKIWPEEQVAAFAREVRSRDPRARVLTVDERTSAAIGRERDLAPTTTDLFADLDEAFAHVLLCIARAAHAYVGVPAGPLHTALAIGERPIVGIWLAHWPEYYDEPAPSAIHLVGPNVYRAKLDQRIAAYTKKQASALRYRIVAFRERMPLASDVLDALASL
ncbi:MAG: hypothetical protein KGN02_07825 [bacterium]|nr:hypothetical protein [bacterium]